MGLCHFPCFQTLPPSWAPQARSEACVTVFERRSHLGPPAEGRPGPSWIKCHDNCIFSGNFHHVDIYMDNLFIDIHIFLCSLLVSIFFNGFLSISQFFEILILVSNQYQNFQKHEQMFVDILSLYRTPLTVGQTLFHQVLGLVWWPKWLHCPLSRFEARKTWTGGVFHPNL